MTTTPRPPTPRPPTEWSRRLAALLVAEGHLERDAADLFLAEAGSANRPVAAILARHNAVEPSVLLARMAAISGMAAVDLELDPPDPDALRVVPACLAREFDGVGYRLDGDKLTLACTEPLSPDALRSLSIFLECQVVGAVLGEPSILDRLLTGDTPDRGAETSLSPQPMRAGPSAQPVEQLVEHADEQLVGAHLLRAATSIAERDNSDSSAHRYERTSPMEDNNPTRPWDKSAPEQSDTTQPGTSQAGAGQPLMSQSRSDIATVPIPSDRDTTLAPEMSFGHSSAPATLLPPPPPPPDWDLPAFDEELSQSDPPSELDVAPGAGPREVLHSSDDLTPPKREPRPFEAISGSKGYIDIDDLLVYAVENGASDLHLTNQLPPLIRVDGSIRPIGGLPNLDNDRIREMIFGILTQALRERFESQKELDTSHAIYGVGRFRVNVFYQRGAVGAVLRSIPHDIPAFSVLGLPDVIASLADLRRGLVLVTGPTGSGKSTTLASIIDIINRTKPLHIMTVEDPIEFLHPHHRAIVNQREVGQDTTSFAEALRHVLRQDPDVILVGEMRDLETISTALTAAETGHLVFASLHTQDAPQTIDRIIDVFPTNQQDQIRIQLASSLEAVVTQQLLLSASGLGRTAVTEIMMCTPAIRNLIRSAKTHQVYSLMQTGSANGMQTMDQGLAKAAQLGRISEAAAYDRCHDPNELREYLSRS